MGRIAQCWPGAFGIVVTTAGQHSALISAVYSRCLLLPLPGSHGRCPKVLSTYTSSVWPLPLEHSPLLTPISLASFVVLT